MRQSLVISLQSNSLARIRTFTRDDKARKDAAETLDVLETIEQSKTMQSLPLTPDEPRGSYSTWEPGPSEKKRSRAASAEKLGSTIIDDSLKLEHKYCYPFHYIGLC